MLDSSQYCSNTSVSGHSPELPQSEHISVADATWLALNVVSGGGNASNSQPIGVTKIAKSVIAPLADHNISVFMLSTYQTDYILVSQVKGCWVKKHTIGSLGRSWFFGNFFCILFFIYLTTSLLAPWCRVWSNNIADTLAGTNTVRPDKLIHMMFTKSLDSSNLQLIPTVSLMSTCLT